MAAAVALRIVFADSGTAAFVTSVSTPTLETAARRRALAQPRRTGWRATAVGSAFRLGMVFARVPLDGAPLADVLTVTHRIMGADAQRSAQGQSSARVGLAPHAVGMEPASAARLATERACVTNSTVVWTAAMFAHQSAVAAAPVTTARVALPRARVTLTGPPQTVPRATPMSPGSVAT